ncbi:PEPxxWA-CTERM sorting domain-containing protein [Sphingomonas sp. PAMC 26617]|uniref:PEPxxWA-CTERM sorting domain-containing protein n=1 Tax=Sphingomonas sp. PAMC 26617 TaxID=1112216 RepID=UPI00028971AE|nr:PEPxxWA-CTERM sorting domain-containing protein [Sphingomonas sp. PAMC 26617]
MKNKLLTLAMASVAAFSASSANAALTVGDLVSIQYYFPSLSAPYGGPQTTVYTGAGQTIASIGNYGVFTLNDDSVSLSPGDSFTFSDGEFNGPALIDLTNADAFAGWTVTDDTIGLSSTAISGDRIAASWQGLSVNPSMSATFSAPTGAVPEPATWAMMLAGFGMIGFAARRRQSIKTTVAYA